MPDQILKAIDEIGETLTATLDTFQDRLEKMEAYGGRPRGDNREKSLKDFPGLVHYWQTGEKNDQFFSEQKDMSIGGTNAGDAFAPEYLDRRIVERMLDLSPIVRAVLSATRANSIDIRIPVNIRGTTTAWTSETGTRSVGTTPTIRTVTPTYGGVYSVLKITQWLAQDSFLNLETYLVNEIANEMVVALEAAIVLGTGSDQPTGFLGGSLSSPQTIVSTADNGSPQRAFGSLQYVASGAASTLPHDPFASPMVHGGDVLLNVVKELRVPYRRNAQWIMNRSTLNTISQWKDLDARYLVSPGMGGEPDRLFGYDIVVTDQMPDIAAGAFPIAFGDLNAAYRLYEVGQPILVRDDVTARGHIHLYHERRYAGQLVDDHALKVLRIATS